MISFAHTTRATVVVLCASLVSASLDAQQDSPLDPALLERLTDDPSDGPSDGDSSGGDGGGFELGGDTEEIGDAVPPGPGLGEAVQDVLGGDSDEEGLESEEEEETNRRVKQIHVRVLNDFRKKRLPATIRQLNELIALRPYNPYFHFALGLCYRYEKQYSEALKKYQDVLDLGGPKALVALLKAEVFASQNKQEKAFEMLREAALGGRNVIQDVQNLPALQKYELDTEFVQLALQLEKVEIAHGSRHDPFTNPFPARFDREDKPGGPDGPDQPIDVTPLTPREQEKLVRDARKVYERIQFFIKLQDEDKAMQAYMQLKDLVAQKNRLTIPKYVKDFQAMIARFEAIEVEIQGIRLRYYYNQAYQKIASMNDLFQDGQFEKVNNLSRQVGKLADDMIAANPKFKPIADQIVDLAREWVDRANVRIEFDSLKPEIQGIILSDKRNMAILNDRIVRQGESFADFRIVKVENNRVTFRFKGEEIPLVFRRY